MNRAEKEKLFLLLQEREKRKSERNEIFEAYRKFKGRYAVLIGGSGSGKSYEIADKYIDRIVREDNHRILCVRAEQKQISESQVPLIVSRIKARYNYNDFKINLSKGNESITYLPNGNKFIFWGLDDVEKLKSIFDITSIWVEEADQTTAADIRELDRRLRGYQGQNKNGTEKYMQISFSFNPVSVLSWLKKRFFDNKEKYQIMLHGEQPFTDCEYYKDLKLPDLEEKIKIFDEDLQEEIERYKHNTLIIHSTYKDNKFIDRTYSQILAKMKEEEPEEYNIYALGMWGIAGGTYFDKASINARIQANIKPIKQGYFEFDYINHEIIDNTIKWIEDKNGYIKIYAEPRKNYPYVIGGDTAGEGSDWNTGIVTDNTTGVEVATLRINFDEDLYARQMYCLGRHYNNALIGVETNFSTHPMKELLRLNYPNQYIREQSPDAFTGKLTKVFGFLTTSKTRPDALGKLRSLVREEPHKILDTDLLLEMTTFVKNEKGRPEAMQGAHDDMVMARAINCYIAEQQRTTILNEQTIDISKFPEDIQEDYYNATPEMRKYILKKLGVLK